MGKFVLGQPGVNPFAKKLKPVSSPPSNANNQAPQLSNPQMNAVKRRLAKDPGDAQDIKQGIKDSPAEDAADAKAAKKQKMSFTN